ncbi:MAG: M56 family metallopeptidase [Oscillospiraceae bacterium]|nr:M56 family metallopeptidase [Oscillospiraceae bacterium]
MTDIFLGFLNRSLAAGILILAVVLVRLVFKKAPRWLLCALWALAAVRLVCPVSIESVLSLIPSAEPVQPEIIVSAQPAITSGIPAVDAIVNPPLAAAFTPSPAQSANPLQIWTFLAACVWLAGIAALLLYAAVSALRLRLRVRTAVRLEQSVYQSEFVPSPFILGVLRPRIYLPYGLEPDAQAMVLAHERAHLRRGDQLWKPLGYLILAAYWFNPLCWLAYILFCRDIEAACDEKVVRELGEGCKAAYSRALLACSVPRKLITACPLAFGETGVKARIRSVLNYKKPAFWLVLAAVLASIAVAVCFLTDPKREDPAQNPPAAEEAAAQAPAQTIDASSAPEPAIDEQAGLDPDFFTGTDGYGNSVTVQALFTAATEAGGNWGAYLPATGWLQEPGRSLWCSEQTGAAFEVGYLPDVPVSSRRHAYAAQGYAEQLLERCTVFTLDTGEENTLLYLYAAETGCYEVRIRWAAGEAQADASGYDAARQAHFDAQLLQQIAASFTPLNADGTAQTRFLLAQADIYTLYTQTEAVPCPYGDAGCQLHSASSLYCETDGVDGERLLDGPRTDTTYWFMHNDAAVGFLRLGFLVQTPAAHGGQFSQGYIDVTVPELRAQAYVSLENYSLSGENPAAPETVGTDSSMPIQPCELTLPNGVYLGLDYETTMQLAQAYRGSRVYRGQTPGDNFTVDGVSYYFSADSSGVLRLDSYSVITTELATQSFLRGIKLGDGLQSVLDTIPTADWQPEELYSQLLYGEDLVSGDRAVLDWNSSIYHPSYYTLIIKSGADSANIKFDHDGSVSGIYVSNY